MATKPKTKKYTTKKMLDGSQQYTRSGVNSETIRNFSNGKRGGKVADMLGRASANAFLDRGVHKLESQQYGKYRAKKRIGKPMGGK